MGSAPRAAVGFLLTAGAILCVAAAASIGVGLLDPGLISDQLPPEAVIDAPAVGGAAVALGIAVAMLGLVHLGIVAALRRGFGIARSAGVVLCASMAVLSLGFAVSALVSVASGAAPAIIMLPAAIGLGGGVIGYAGATLAIMRVQRTAI